MAINVRTGFWLKFLEMFEDFQPIVRGLNDALGILFLVAVFGTLPYFIWKIPIYLLKNEFGFIQARYCFYLFIYILPIYYAGVKNKQVRGRFEVIIINLQAFF